MALKLHPRSRGTQSMEGLVLRSRLTFLFLIATFIFCSNLWAAGCRDLSKLVSEFFGKKSAPLLFDAKPHDLSPELLEIRDLLANMNTSEFDSFWKSINPDDAEKYAKQLEAKSKKQELPKGEKLFLALYNHLGANFKNTLWPDENSNAYASLLRHTPSFSPPAHYGRIGGTIDNVDTSTLTDFEGELVRAALKPRSSPMKGISSWNQFWFHPYRRIQTILQFNRLMRAQLETTQQIRDDIKIVESAASRMSATEDETTAIKDALAIVDKERLVTKDEMQKAYSQDISTGGIQRTEEVNIRKIAARINDGLLDSEEKGTHVDAAQKAMDEMAKALDSMSLRITQHPRTMADFLKSELKVRHRQYTNQTNRAIQDVDNFLGADSRVSFTVYYRWTETVPEEVPDGHDQNGNPKTRTVYKTVVHHDYATVQPSYADIFHNRLTDYDVGSSFTEDGHDGTIEDDGDRELIARASARVAGTESNLYNQFSRLHERLSTLISDHAETLTKAKSDESSITKAKAQLSKIESELNELVLFLESYARWNPSQVQHQWADDDSAHFTQRNQARLQAAKNLQALLPIYREQLERKEFELVITPEVPDYSKEVQLLRNSFIRNQFYKWVPVATAAAIAGVKIFEWYQKTHPHSRFH